MLFIMGKIFLFLKILVELMQKINFFLIKFLKDYQNVK